MRLLAFILIALGVLFSALAAGHRTSINSDEANVVDRALRLFSEGPNPRWFVYPSLHLYAVAAAEGGLYAARRALGLSANPDAFAAWYFTNPRGVLVAARSWSLAAGIATLWIVFRLGARLASPWAGLWAATFLALSPLQVYYAAIAKPDAAMALAMAAGALLAVRHVQERRDGLAWGPAMLGGLAATVKYPGGAAWVAAPVAMLLSPAPARRSLAGWLSGAAALAVLAALVFFAGTPFALAEPGLLYRDLAMHRQVAAQGMPGMEGVTAWRFYLGSALPGALSLPILALAAAGALVLLRQDGRATLTALAPAAAYAVPTFSATLAQYGFALPLLPVLCVCAGAGLEAARGAFARRPRLAAALAATLLLLGVAAPLEADVCGRVRALHPTAQEQAAAWIRAHLPPGTRIFGASTGLTMLLPLSPERLDELIAEATRDRPTGGARLRHLRGATPAEAGYYFYDMEGYEPTRRTGEPRVTEYDPAWIEARGFAYVVDSEEKMRMFLRAPDRHPLPFRFQRWLAERGELVFTTHPGSRGLEDWQEGPERTRALEPRCGFAGHELRIYRIRPTTAGEPAHDPFSNAAFGLVRRQFGGLPIERAGLACHPQSAIRNPQCEARSADLGAPPGG